MSKRKRERYGNPVNRKPLVGDLKKFVQPTGNADPRNLGGSIIGGAPREQNTALLDMTDCVLLEGSTVSTVALGRQGELYEQAVYLVMSGRVNKTTRQVNVGFIFGSDGAATLITELLAVADRFGVELLKDLVERLVILQKDNNIDLHFLKAAIDLAIEESE